MEIFQKKKDLRFNCKRENIDGVNFVICSPEIVEGNLRVPIGNIKFRELDDGTLELIETTKMDQKTTDEIRKYLEELGFRIKI